MISDGVLNYNKLLNTWNRRLFMEYSLGQSGQVRWEKCALRCSQAKWSFLESQWNVSRRLRDKPWSSGVREAKDLKLSTLQLKKRSLQLIIGFELPQRWLAAKHNFFWHPDCQCWTGCSKGKCLLHNMALVLCGMNGLLWSPSELK